MLFNVDKCTVIHIGCNNLECDYKLGENIIRSSTNEREMLGMIKRNITFKSKDVITTLYKALVRPRLEFGVQAWCPHVRKDIDVTERVQR